VPKQIARWNPARDVWEMETTGLFCEHSDVFSATWPASGMTRAGVAYELPTSARRTDGSASSSWRPTPEPLTPESGWLAGLFEGEGYITVRTDTKRPRILLGLSMTDEDVVRRFAQAIGVGTVRGPYAQRGLGTKPTWRWTITTRTGSEAVLNRLWDGLCSRRRAKATEAMTTVLGFVTPPIQDTLLPTPVADHSRGLPQPGTDYASLPNVVMDLLPTPESSDATGGRMSSEVGGVRPSGAKRAITLATRVGALLPSSGASTNPQFDGGNEC
jgi:hypothetical protein